ncbi:MAG TPA: hypothetical protein PLS53_07570 [Thermoanaerobaculaceae bacterium]|nr:hypothetical protein [Thermoanaerobaculaceae bacterium]
MVDPTQVSPPPGAPAAGPEGETPPAAQEALPAAEVGAPPPVKAASKAVRALTHAANSFQLYEASNEAVAGFIGDLRQGLDQFLSTYGPLALEIRPWDITFQGQVVFLDRDRERSLAFRLYRDGVRKLHFEPEVTWDEIIDLLGVLAIRAKGIRQHEDDVVTMLWNASFKHIRVEAVEGLVAEDDERVAEVMTESQAAVAPRTTIQAMVFDAPYLFDYPLPPLADRASVAYRPIAPHMIERLRRQDSLDGLAIECAQLVSELLELMADEFDPLHLEDVAPLLREIRGYLLQDGLFRPLVEILKIVASRAPADPETREKLLSAVADSEVFRRLLEAVGNEQKFSVDELTDVAGLLPGDQVPAILDFLATHPDGAGRGAGIRLLEHTARTRPDRICERLLANRDEADLDLLRMLDRANPTEAVNVALDLLASRTPRVQIAAIVILGRAPYGARIGRALVGVLRAPAEDVRRRALDALVAQKERRAYDTLAEQLRTATTGQVPLPEAAAIGAAMARLEPERSRKLFGEWVKPPGLLGRLASVPLWWRWAAVSGLAVLGGPDARELVEWLAGKASGELQQHCQAALEQMATPEGGRP